MNTLYVYDEDIMPLVITHLIRFSFLIHKILDSSRIDGIVLIVCIPVFLR